MASERVWRVVAKVFALSAKVRRRAFLMLQRGQYQVHKKRKVHSLSDGLIDDLASLPFPLKQDIPLVVEHFQLEII